MFSIKLQLYFAKLFKRIYIFGSSKNYRYTLTIIFPLFLHIQLLCQKRHIKKYIVTNQKNLASDDAINRQLWRKATKGKLIAHCKLDRQNTKHLSATRTCSFSISDTITIPTLIKFLFLLFLLLLFYPFLDIMI